jgi:MFS family permease
MTFASEVNGHLLIPAHWQSAWNAMYNVMTLVGSLAAAEWVDRFGCRLGFLLTAIVAAAGVALNYVAQNPQQFLGGKMITGTAVGIAMTVGQKYVSEIAPMPMRGIALSFNTICMVSTRAYEPWHGIMSNTVRTSVSSSPSLRLSPESASWTSPPSG